MVFLDSLYSPPHPIIFNCFPQKNTFPLFVFFFINRAKKRQFLLYCRRSPRWHLQFSQRFALCITIHTPPSQFTKIYNISYKLIHSLQLYVFLYIFRPLYHNPHFPITILTTTKLIRQGKKHRKNCECCPGHYLIVNHYSWMSWFKFRNVPVIVNCVTKSLIH